MIHLHTHSRFSPLGGLNSVDELCAEVKSRGHLAIALTDTNGVYGVVEFVRACRETGIHSIAGIEFRKGDHFLYTGLARNPNGFRELNDFLSYHNETGLPLPDYAPQLSDVWFVYAFFYEFTR